MAMREETKNDPLVDFCLDLTEGRYNHEYANGIKIGYWNTHIFK